METERLTLTVEETAKLLGIGRQLAYYRVRTGEIPVIKIGRRLLVPRRALDRLLEQGNVVSQSDMTRRSGDNCHSARKTG